MTKIEGNIELFRKNLTPYSTLVVFFSSNAIHDDTDSGVNRVIEKNYFEFCNIEITKCDLLFFRDLNKSWYTQDDLWNNCANSIAKKSVLYERIVLVGISAGAAAAYVVSKYLSHITACQVDTLCFSPIMPNDEALCIKYKNIATKYNSEHNNTVFFINCLCPGEVKFASFFTDNVSKIVKMPYRKHGLIGGSAIDIVLIVEQLFQKNKLFFLYNLRTTGFYLSPRRSIQYNITKLKKLIERKLALY